jgi:hypothetical protein
MNMNRLVSSVIKIILILKRRNSFSPEFKLRSYETYDVVFRVKNVSEKSGFVVTMGVILEATPPLASRRPNRSICLCGSVFGNYFTKERTSVQGWGLGVLIELSHPIALHRTNINTTANNTRRFCVII